MRHPLAISRLRVLASVLALAAATAAGTSRPAEAAGGLEEGFRHPPDSARPWVYWFWLNGNITREGITADLEAMARTGIGGVLIMEVDQGAPVGEVDFMGEKWRELFRHVVAEAGRLGLEVNMNDDAGWNGSGGPWIKPEESMQKVVWSEVEIEGPRRFEGTLAKPKSTAGFYRDIAVLAFPTPGAFRIENIPVKAGYQVGGVGPSPTQELPPGMAIDRPAIVDLTARMDGEGRISWDAPSGKWTLMRFGHTSTGMENAPAPATGRGLECDKLSREGIEACFRGMMGKLIQDVGPAAGKALAATHIDSWENGSQNWTARMREEFRKRRGYDLLPFLPAFTGRVVESLAVSERFLWDLRQTISDLVVENYAGRMRELAREHGLRLSIEAYGGPCDDLPYAGRADEPMCEFWVGGGALNTLKEMASAAHTYGKTILGAESFTAADQERWLEHPGSVKALGDQAFTDGVNRFVFHRYALQPWTDRRPGMTMGPWGLHYERTQTWWEWSRPWHEYLARCQFLLRQGLFVADICYLEPESSPQAAPGHHRQGYDHDVASPEVVLTRMSVKEGRIVLPDGMSYRILVLPDHPEMTPALLSKIKDLVQAGATVLGSRPLRSPSLSGYPACDAEVKRLAGDLWGDSDGKAPGERRVGGGRVAWGVSPEALLARSGVRPDFQSGSRLRYIHRSAEGSEIYFVSNPASYPVTAACAFRGSLVPVLWWPETGTVSSPVWERVVGGSATGVHLTLGPQGSVFVVLRKHPGDPQGVDPVTAVMRDGETVLSASLPRPKVKVEKATYGVPGDPGKTIDARERVEQILASGEMSFQVSRLAEAGDPAANMKKTLVVEFTVDGRPFKVTGQDPETVHLTGDAGKIVVVKATYGPPGDPGRTRDVRAKLQRVVDAGETSLQVARMAEGDDPAFGVVKTLVVEYTADGKPATATATDPERIDLARPGTPSDPLADIREGADGRPVLEAWKAGRYELKRARGKTLRLEVASLPAPLEVTGPWEVRFPPNLGAPEKVTLEKIASLSEHADPGVRNFSGAATYARTFTVAKDLLGGGRRLSLDLGKVQVMARVKLNGKDLGILWKPPYRLDVTEAAKPGENALELEVVNLWVNRMIGDEDLPEDSDRNPDGTLKAWPRWVLDGKPSPAGRFTFTSWRLWKKGSKLLESGLIGPVKLLPSERVPLDS